MINYAWNPDLYQNRHAFVWQYGESVLQLLSPQSGESILDLGCGTGQLTDKIAQTGAVVQGIDADLEMINQAKINYPHLSFRVADARDFQVDQPFDAIFSNAVLHWIKEPDAVIKSIYNHLKPGGRFVAEFGGKGNVENIINALELALKSMDLSQANPFYFPSIGDYTTRLENQGFSVIYATLFDRLTPLESGEDGLKNWIKMFGKHYLVDLSVSQQQQVIEIAEKQLRSKLYQEGKWFVDYRRIRLVAIKP